MTVLATTDRTAVQNRASVLAWFRGVLAGAAGLLALAAAPTAPGATLPPGFAETRVTDGLGSSTAMAFTPDGRILARGRGAVDGLLVEVARGTGGFGYDPHFLVPEFGRTFAEIGAAEKNRVSHRARALADLRRSLTPLLAPPGTPPAP